MTFAEIVRNLGNKIFAPVYFFHGEEPWYIDQLTDLIEDSILDAATRDFNQSVIYGYDVTPREVVDLARQFPMMGNYQVVIVKEAQELKSWDEIEKYIAQPLSTTILVLAHKHKKVDKRKAFYKTITGSKNVVVFESVKIRDNKIPDFIKEELAKKGFNIESRALQLMAEYLGNDLGKINNELQKLLINLPPNTRINEDHIEQNIGISKDFNVFELQNALVQRDILKAQRIVNYFEANPKDNPIQMLTPMLHNFFMKVFLYSNLAGNPPNIIASEIGVSPYFLSEYALAAKSFSPLKVKGVISDLRKLDLKSKGVDSTDSTGYDDLKVLVYKILN